MQLNQIREDLKEIRYYYSKKDFFDKACTRAMSNILAKVKRYNSAIEFAELKLYELYVNLYMSNLTQEAVANEQNYSTEYIQMLNKKLLLYLQKKLDD